MQSLFMSAPTTPHSINCHTLMNIQICDHWYSISAHKTWTTHYITK